MMHPFILLASEGDGRSKKWYVPRYLIGSAKLESSS